MTMNRRMMVMEADGGGAAGGGGTGAAATPPAWYAGFSDENKGYVEAKGFKDPQAVVEGYRNAEKKLGVPQEKLIHLPDKDDAPEWAGIHTRLGKPEKAEGYEFDMGNEELTKWTRETLHGLNLTKKQGEAMAAKWKERAATQSQSREEQATLESDNQYKALEKEWGAAFKTKVAAVNEFAKAAGISGDQFQKLESALGVDGFSKLLDGIVTKFGIKLGEAPFRGTQDGGTGNSFGPMSPAAAKAQKDMYLGDPEWVKRYQEGGVKEKQQMEHVEKMIWEGKQVAQRA